MKVEVSHQCREAGLLSVVMQDILDGDLVSDMRVKQLTYTDKVQLQQFLRIIQLFTYHDILS